ncbi:hypothetical protein JCM8097_007576 [Rhodosporidiobolus ruineniae]
MNTDCTDCQPPSAAAPIPAPTPSSSSDSVLDPSTFVPPRQDEAPRVAIEFCDRCRWLHRAVWTQTELFLTFPPSTDPSSSSGPGLRGITLIPRNAPETGGRFRVWLLNKPELRNKEKQEKSWEGWDLVWDRKIEGRFPEMKELKQRIRNLIAPFQSLGHSDKPSVHASSAQPASSSAASSSAPAPPPVPTPAPSAEVASEEAAASEQDAFLQSLGIKTDGSEAVRQDGQLLASDFAPSYRCA